MRARQNAFAEDEEVPAQFLALAEGAFSDNYVPIDWSEALGNDEYENIEDIEYYVKLDETWFFRTVVENIDQPDR